MSTAIVRIKARTAQKYIPTKVDTERVKNLVLLGCPEETIAQCIGEYGIGLSTLREHYGPVLTRYRTELLGKIAASIYKSALDPKDGGDPNIPPEIRSRHQIFILKTRAGWKESDTTVINANNVQIVKRVVGVDDKDI